MKENVLVSVIVPIYNVKEYLVKCIESLCAQTYQNIEIILVDDGSTDGCSIICDEYAKRDHRIQVIHKVNGGIASARKAGVCEAKGAYIGFVDGDDWVEPEMYEDLLGLAIEHHAQVVLSDMYREKFTGEQTMWSGADFPEGVYDVKEQISLIATHLISGINTSNNGINGGVHIKLFEKEMLKKLLPEIDDCMNGFGEDKAIVYSAILESDRIYITHKAYYHGVDRKASATHSKNPLFFEQLQWFYLYLKEKFEKHPSKDILLEQLYNLLMISSISNINMLAGRTIVPTMMMGNRECISGKKIVLYGAGVLGRAYKCQICSERLCDIVLWVDKGQADGVHVFPIEKILESEYDLILVAIKESTLYDSVKSELMTMGIAEEKIIWSKPMYIHECFGER